MVLGALGRAPGGIWAPTGPKAEKGSKIAPFYTPGVQLGAQKKVIWRHFMMFCSSCFSRSVFSSIFSDFRVRNRCFFGVADMAEVL